jgi:hypothetical protein
MTAAAPGVLLFVLGRTVPRLAIEPPSGAGSVDPVRGDAERA